MTGLFIEADMDEMFTVSVYKNATGCDTVLSGMHLETFQSSLPPLATEYKHVFCLFFPYSQLFSSVSVIVFTTILW